MLFEFPRVVIARAESPWRSTVSQRAKRIPLLRFTRHDGLPRRSLALPPRNDKSVYGHQTAHFFLTSSCHREGVARGDPLGTSKQTALLNSLKRTHLTIPLYS